MLLRRDSVILIWIVILLCFADTESAKNGENTRTKRQQPYDNNAGNAFIDSIFNIPISTLNAVGDLIKNTRPVVQEVRRRAEQQYQQYQENRRKTTPEYIDLRRTTPRTPRSHAARVAGVRQAYDGSAYRI